MDIRRQPSRWKLAGAGLWPVLLAGIVMTTVMLFIASIFGVATPLAIVGDRLSVFFHADTFLDLMRRVGGYNRMKQLGVVSSIVIGQIMVGGSGWCCVTRSRRLALVDANRTAALPKAASSCSRWWRLRLRSGRCSARTTADCQFRNATLVTIVGLLVSFVAFERTLVLELTQGLSAAPARLPQTRNTVRRSAGAR